MKEFNNKDTEVFLFLGNNLDEEIDFNLLKILLKKENFYLLDYKKIKENHNKLNDLIEKIEKISERKFPLFFYTYIQKYLNNNNFKNIHYITDSINPFINEIFENKVIELFGNIKQKVCLKCKKDLNDCKCKKKYPIYDLNYFNKKNKSYNEVILKLGFYETHLKAKYKNEGEIFDIWNYRKKKNKKIIIMFEFNDSIFPLSSYIKDIQKIDKENCFVVWIGKEHNFTLEENIFDEIIFIEDISSDISIILPDILQKEE